ncbi:MAG: neuraminidase-like domain-containing protein [Chloroflexota bacterium]|nr:neuraminidase-like domain-containing protein [Chloroflexota bacterium]
MKLVVAPLFPDQQGPDVANLQDALRLFVERARIPISDAERLEVMDRLSEERAAAFYGEVTRRLVVLFRVAFGLNDLDVVDEPTAAAMNAQLRELGALDEQRPFVVRGQVRLADGEPIAEVRVRAFDVDLRNRELLGEVPLGEDGRYEIRYGPEQFARAEKDGPDLWLEALTSNGDIVAKSNVILFHAGPETLIDLIVESQASPAPSEFEQLTAELEPLLNGLSLAELVENEDQQDITFLVGETGREREQIERLITSARLVEETKLVEPDVHTHVVYRYLPHAILYAWARQNLASDLDSLLAQPDDVLRHALDRAIAERMIPASLNDAIDGALQHLHQISIARELQPSANPARPSLQDRFGDLLDAEKLRTLAEVNVERPFLSEEWQNSLVERGFEQNDVERIRTVFALGALVQNNLSLAQALRTHYEIETPNDLRALAALDRDQWISLAVDHGIPEERRARYANEIAHNIEQTFATAVIARRIEQGEFAVSEDARPLLTQFFANNPAYEFDTQSITAFLAEGGGANLQGFERAQLPQLKEELLRLDRVRKLVPRSPEFALADTANALLSEGFDSAYRIATLGRRDFVDRMKAVLAGGEQAATAVFTQAERNASMALVLASEYASVLATPVAAVTSPPPQAQPSSAGAQIPDLTTLFGNLNFCECAHCRSVYSPAAYLVDLLKFIEDRQAATKIKVMDVLMGRRPDLAEIELTCANTNTPIPYIDLVNEILQDAVAPLPAFAPFALSAAAISQLDSGDVTALKNAHPGTLVASLSADAEIEVKKRGELWTIDDVAVSYTVRTNNGVPEVVTRSRQTKGTAPERAAQPQYTNHAAYTTLRQQVFPWLLPFDFPFEQVNAYLQHLGVTRAQIMETFLPDERQAILKRYDVASAYLGLSNAEAKIITGETIGRSGAASQGIWNFWGFDAAQGSIPDPGNNTADLTGTWIDLIKGRVDVVQQQSGLTYRELLDLLDTYFVNPVVNAQRKISIVSTDPASPETCQTDKLALQGFDLDSAVRVVRFGRLWRRLGWSMRDLDRAITVFAPPLASTSTNDIPQNQAFLVQLAHVERLRQALKLPVARLLSAWANLDTARYRDFTDAQPVWTPSVYAQIFRNRAVLNPLDPDFVEDATKLQGTLSGNSDTVAAALGLSLQDLTLLTNDVKVLPDTNTPPQPDDTLNLPNLSRLYRHAMLTKALRIPIRDYLILLHLIDIQPFASTVDTLMFIERVQQVREAGFSVAELDYLLRHRLPMGVTDEDEKAAATALDALRRTLQQLAAEYDALDPTSDTQGELARQKLALLNWDGALVEQVIATLNGTVTYEVTLDVLPTGFMAGKRAVDLAALPTGVTIPATLPVTYTTQTNKLEAARLLSPSERAQLRGLSSDNSYIAAVTALEQLQDELQVVLLGGLSYGETTDSTNQPQGRLRHTGPITLAYKAVLDGLTLPQGYNAQSYQQAVQALFDAPREFVRRAMRRYSVQDYSVNLNALPQALTFPQPLQPKIYYDRVEQKLHFVGVMLEQERDTLLRLSTDNAYQAAVLNLYNSPTQGTADSGDAFLTTTGQGNDIDALFNPSAASPGARFARVLGKLLPHLHRILSERAAQQTVAEAFQMESATAEALLRRWLIHPDDRTPTVTAKRPIMAALLDPAFVGSHPDVELTPVAFPGQFRAFTLLQKVGQLIAHFGINTRQIRWLTEYGASIGWLNFNSLPLTSTDQPASLNDLLRVSALFHLRDALANGEAVLDEIFRMARDTNQLSTLLERLSVLTGWPLSDLQELASTQGLNLSLTSASQNSFHDERALARLVGGFALLKRLGMTAKQCGALARESDVTQTSANNVVRAVRAKYDEARWLEIAPPLRDVLREKQRAALVAYLVNRPDTARGQTWRDMGDLYAHFLIDVEMSPCFMTSRIKQATSVIQLFVQRCLLNLEQNIAPSVIDLTWWKWMKNYRVWEANRKVFVYPENWIEPELRHDKSPFFQDLESQLQQGDVTPDNVERAFLSYLENLERVARLEVVCAYHEVKDPTQNRTVLHVLARTFDTPSAYYYRRWVDGSYWTAWEPVALDIESDHILPVVWMQQLYLFWLKFSEKATEKIPNKDTPELPDKRWEVQLAYSEYKNGKWTAKQLINLELPLGGQLVYQEKLEQSGKVSARGIKREWFVLGAITQGRSLKVVVGSPRELGMVLGFVWNHATRTGRHGSFTTDNRIWSNIYPTPFNKLPVASTTFQGNQFRESLSTGQVPLQMLLADKGTNDQLNRNLSTMVTVLGRNTAAERNAFKVAFAQRLETFDINNTSNTIYARYVLQDPFFYQDTTRTYFAHYDESFDLAGYWAAVWAALMKEGVYQPPDPQNFYRKTVRFSTFYHPHVGILRETLMKEGLDGLLSLSSQRHADAGQVPGPSGPMNVEAGATFINEYRPTNYVYPYEYPKEIVDFDARGTYAQYNWELFFHAPFLIATRLTKNQRYEEAQKWFHFIFDPTTNATDPVPRRYWRVKPFYDEGQGSSIERLLKILADKSNTSREKADLDAQVKQWRENPFMPHAVARWRPRAYMLSVVMKYLDNLIAWGDQLFRRDTIESINEATQIYILAAEILGRRPEKVLPRVAPQAQTYNSLKPALDSFGNALVGIEEFIQPSGPSNGNSPAAPPISSLKMLYFCVPYNDKLLTYWDVVEDRLFKIRHCMNIEGVTRQLPLFEPPIDPGMLVKAAAAGVDLASALSDLNAPLPHYRFITLSQKASELCADVKSMGASLLSALEKRDAEAVTLLRSTHEISLLEATRVIKEYQIGEAQASLDALTESLKMARTRLTYYTMLLSTVETVAIPQRSQQSHLERLFTALVEVVETFDPRIEAAKALGQLNVSVVSEVRESLALFNKIVSGTGDQPGQEVEQITLPMNRFEKRQLDELKLSNQSQLRAMDYEALAQILALIPDVTLGVQGGFSSPVVQAQIGGTLLSTMARLKASQFNYDANEHSYRANLHSILAGYQRRAAEWLHQCDLALTEIEQIGKQMLSACMRLAVAQQDLRTHEQQIQNARDVDAFMRDKYTNEELYEWMVGQLSNSYFQSYQLAYDVAKRAERAYRHELGIEDSSFIQFGYWDSLKKGLLAGERLYHDLKRMEVSYLDQHRREYEITKHVSLVQLDPVALIQLKQSGACFISIPEAVFDLDHPGQYMRRIKSVSLTVPCVVGPYTTVSCRLTLLKSSIRRRNVLPGGTYVRQGTDDNRFTDILGSTQSIVTSSAQNDSGLFEPNLRDDRYLFFEGAGAISEWRLELLAPFPQFDYSTITDVIFHIRYTAREGGDALRTKAIKEMQDDLASLMKLGNDRSGLMRMFSMRHEFPNKWYRLVQPATAANRTITLDIARDRFPYFASTRQITPEQVRAYIIDKNGSMEVKTVPFQESTDASGTWKLEIDVEAPTSATDVFAVCQYTI